MQIIIKEKGRKQNKYKKYTKNNKKDGLSELIAAMKQKRKSNEIKKLHKQA